MNRHQDTRLGTASPSRRAITGGRPHGGRGGAEPFL